jgi:peptidoglycan hydrolase CwlO-like protein
LFAHRKLKPSRKKLKKLDKHMADLSRKLDFAKAAVKQKGASIYELKLKIQDIREDNKCLICHGVGA